VARSFSDSSRVAWKGAAAERWCDSGWCWLGEIWPRSSSLDARGEGVDGGVEIEAIAIPLRQRDLGVQREAASLGGPTKE
jgi:hypothetical protein